jgi:hypothetical protein
LKAGSFTTLFVPTVLFGRLISERVLLLQRLATGDQRGGRVSLEKIIEIMATHHKPRSSQGLPSWPGSRRGSKGLRLPPIPSARPKRPIQDIENPNPVLVV